MTPTVRHPSINIFLAFALAGCLILAFVGCQEAPAIEKIDPQEAKPGATVAIAGKGFSEKLEKVAVTLGEVEAPVTSPGRDSLVIELPAQLEPGTYDLVVTNRDTKKSSEPVKFRVIDIVMIPPGTALHVRTVETISSARNQAGDSVLLTLDRPLTLKGRTIAAEGSLVVGRVIHAKESGRVKGRAELGFTVVELKPSSGTRSFQLVTDRYYTRAEGTKKRDAAIIGAGAGLGAAVGAITGGKKGALIGAGAGGTAGTGVVLVTRGKEVEIPAGSRFTFRLSQPIEVELSGSETVTRTP